MLFAHQGGWDEMLLVAAPLALFWFLLARVRRRAEAALPSPTEMTEGQPVVTKDD